MKLQFLGAAGTVTGSRYLLERGEHRILVDAGLFQGYKELRLRNWDPFPVDPAKLRAVVLTHAHLDHSGFLPRLAKLGLRAPIHSTRATAALCRILLPDSGRLQEEEAAYANRKGFSRHRPALALYTEADAQQVLGQFRVHAFGTEFAAAPGIRAAFSPAGHILGAASVRLAWERGSVLFSGDLGRSDDLVLRPPAAPPQARYLVIESTYGSRLHEKADVLAAMANAINRALARGGVVVVPAFAVGRAQSILYALHRLRAEKRIPAVPVFLNSPMAAQATTVFQRHRAEHRLSRAEADAACRVAHVVATVDESKALNERAGPMIIISASGMATGGRVLHHLKSFAPDERNLIMLTGFQAAGTRGWALEQGATEIRIHGDYVPVRAEVVNIDMLSAHADYAELMAWLQRLRRAPECTFITHGEPASADALRVRIEASLGWNCRVPRQGEAFALD